MPKRKIDPTTGERQLSYKEQQFINQYINNGGNASRAAASAGYSSTRPDQSAYQVLRRPEVQRRICQRVAESRVTSDEIIGTLASLMRGTVADFLDESGEFSMHLAIQRGVDHQLKNITTTTREIKATKARPAQVVRTSRGSLHSPIQAARVLAHILGLDRNSTRSRPLATDHWPPPTDHRPLTTDHLPLATDFDPLVWLDDLISESAPLTFVPPAPDPDQNLIHDNDDCAETSNLHSSAQGPAPAEPSDNGLLGEVSPPAAAAVPPMQGSESTSDYSKFDDLYRFVFSKLSERDGEALKHLRFRDLVPEWMQTRNLNEDRAIDAIRDRARSEQLWFSCLIDVCITEYIQMRSAGLIPEPIRQQQKKGKRKPTSISTTAPPTENSFLINVSGDEAHGRDSRLPTQDYGLMIPPAENSAFINVSAPDPDTSNSTNRALDSGPSPPLAENAAFTNVSAPEPGNFDPRLRTQDRKPTSESGSNSRPQTLDSHLASSDSPDP